MNIDTLDQLITNWSLLLIPLITGIIQVIKAMLPKKYHARFIPGISLVSGIVTGLFVLGFEKKGVLVGAIMGLSASGLYSAIKSPLKSTEKSEKYI